MGKSIKIGISILFVFYLSCNPPTQPPPPGSGLLILTVADASCTEAWIELKTNDVALPVNVNILANNSVIVQLNNLNHSDTTIYIDSLLPNKNYQFQAQLTQSILNLNSNKLEVKTLDTTSHNFAMQTFTFGDPAVGSSHLNDVAIIDENNIWAVGEIYMNDSTGQPDPYPYNLVIWNGVSWKLQKVTYQGIPPVIHSILAVNSNDVWLDTWSHWDGQKFQELTIDPVLIGVGINKMWGNSNEIYLVGNSGFIAHKNINSTWQKIESGTTTIIRDIWGTTNPSDNSPLIYCAVSNILSQGDHKILKINNNSTVTEKYWGFYYIVTSIWFKSNYKMYVCGDYIAENSKGNLYPWIVNTTLPRVGTLRIRGTDYNNVLVVGSYGLAAHFNGVSWGILRPLNYGAEVYYSCDVKAGIMCAVGEKDAQGMVTIFR